MVSIVGCPADGVIVASSAGQVSFIDAITKTSTAPQSFPVSVPSVIRRAADGHACFLADNILYRWSVADAVLTPVAAAPGCSMLAEASPGVWILADATSIYRVRL